MINWIKRLFGSRFKARIVKSTNTIFNKLNAHQFLINTNTKSIKDLISEINKIKQDLDSLKNSNVQIISPTKRPSAESNTTNHLGEPDKLIIKPEEYTLQEKKILAVLLDHPNMALSYQDISAILNKSANTVKNQLNQLKIKTNILFEQKDQDNKKRFKIKEGVKIEQYAFHK